MLEIISEPISDAYLRRRYRQLITSQKNILASQQRVFDEHSSLWGVKDLNALIYDTPATDSRDLPTFVSKLRGKDLQFIGLTSGTTGQKSKHIPVNRAQAKAFDNFQLSVASVVNQYSPMRPFLDRRLSWGTSPQVEQDEDGVPMGYISGYISQRGPKFLRQKSYPSARVNLISEMDQKLRALFQETIQQDIRCLTGVPTYLQNVLRNFSDWQAEATGQTLAEAWPDLRTCVYSSAPIAPYREELNRLAGRSLQYFGTYLATEGPLGLEIPEMNGGRAGLYSLNVEDIFFSFQDASTGATNGRRMGFKDLKEGDNVEILISAPNGLCQYKIGDVLRVARAGAQPLFEVLGRAGQMLNIAAEKATEVQFKKAFEHVKINNPELQHFFVHPMYPTGSRPHYQWTVISPERPVDLQSLAQKLDGALGQFNGDYEEARLVTQVIDQPQISWMPETFLKKQFEKFGAKGQLKPKYLFANQAAFENFSQGVGAGL